MLHSLCAEVPCNVYGQVHGSMEPYFTGLQQETAEGEPRRAIIKSPSCISSQSSYVMPVMCTKIIYSRRGVLCVYWEAGLIKCVWKGEGLTSRK